MRLNEVTRALAAGAVLYVVMAACGSSGRNKGPGPTASSDPDASAQGGMQGTSGAGMVAAGTGGLMGELDAMVDAMTDPVPDAAAEPATSGTRIRARYYNGEDGSRQFVGWRDTERDEDCSFQQAEDGQTRCTPTYLAPAVYYADAGCTQPLAAVSKPATGLCGVTVTTPVPQYAADYRTTLCSGSVKVLQVGATALPSLVYTFSGTCGAGVAPNAAFDYYSTTPVPASSFVAATEEVE